MNLEHDQCLLITQKKARKHYEPDDGSTQPTYDVLPKIQINQNKPLEKFEH